MAEVFTPSDVLYAQQNPQKLSKLTVDEAFYIKQDPYSVAKKLGVSVAEVCDNESGSYELASLMNKSGEEEI